MKFVSLFAGIGGFDLGFERAGHTCVAQVEIDLHAQNVLAYRWPNVPRFTDIRHVGAHNLPECDIVCGGFPCQDLSIAGLRKGFAGERSSLFFEMIRIVYELRPMYVVWENVPGLFSSNNGRDFAAVLMALDRLGYSGGWTGLDSRFFGLAQRRRRIFGIFARGDIGASRCTEILSFPARLRRDSATRRGTRTNTFNATTPEFGVSVTGALNAGVHPCGYNGQDAYSGLLVADALTANYANNGGCSGGNDSKLMRNLVMDRQLAAPRVARQAKGGFTDPENDNLIVTPIDTTQITSLGNYSNPQPGDPYHPLSSSAHTPVIAFESRVARNGRGAPSDVVPPLKAQSGNGGKGDSAPLIAFSSKDYGQDESEGISPTLRAMNFDQSHIGGGGQVAIIQHASIGRSDEAGPQGTGIRDDGTAWTLDSRATSDVVASAQTGVRRLTPIECERLQGFPDDWTLWGASGEISNSQRYKMLGNAVSVPVTQWIGRKLKEFE